MSHHQSQDVVYVTDSDSSPPRTCSSPLVVKRLRKVVKGQPQYEADASVARPQQLPLPSSEYFSRQMSVTAQTPDTPLIMDESVAATAAVSSSSSSTKLVTEQLYTDHRGIKRSHTETIMEKGESKSVHLKKIKTFF